jgi:hypothetical protein
MKVIASVQRQVGEKNYSCYMRVDCVKASSLGYGASAKSAMMDMLKGWEEVKMDLMEDGKEVPNLEVEYAFDLPSLFNFYDFINIAGVSREIGISAAVMRQYAIGVRRPSDERKAQIVYGIRRIAEKLETVAVL